MPAPRRAATDASLASALTPRAAPAAVRGGWFAQAFGWLPGVAR
jgi:hypothetical protein